MAHLMSKTNVSGIFYLKTHEMQIVYDALCRARKNWYLDKFPDKNPVKARAENNSLLPAYFEISNLMKLFAPLDK